MSHLCSPMDCSLQDPHPGIFQANLSGFALLLRGDASQIGSQSWVSLPAGRCYRLSHREANGSTACDYLQVSSRTCGTLRGDLLLACLVTTRQERVPRDRNS